MGGSTLAISSQNAWRNDHQSENVLGRRPFKPKRMGHLGDLRQNAQGSVAPPPAIEGKGPIQEKTPTKVPLLSQGVLNSKCKPMGIF